MLRETTKKGNAPSTLRDGLHFLSAFSVLRHSPDRRVGLSLRMVRNFSLFAVCTRCHVKTGVDTGLCKATRDGTSVESLPRCMYGTVKILDPAMLRWLLSFQVYLQYTQYSVHLFDNDASHRWQVSVS